MMRAIGASALRAALNGNASTIPTQHVLPFPASIGFVPTAAGDGLPRRASKVRNQPSLICPIVRALAQ